MGPIKCQQEFQALSHVEADSAFLLSCKVGVSTPVEVQVGKFGFSEVQK